MNGLLFPLSFCPGSKRSSNSLTGSYFRERNRFHEFLNEELNLLSNQEFKEYPGKFLGEIENIRIRFPVPKTAYLQNNGKVREANKKTNPLKGKCAPKKRVSSNFVNEKRTERGPSPGVQGIPSKKGKFISNKTTNENSLSEKTPLIPVQPSISHLRIPKKSQTVRTPEHTHIPNSYYDSKELSNSREEHGKRSVPNRKKQLELQDSDEGQNVNETGMPCEHARPVQTPLSNKEFTLEKPTTVQQATTTTTTTYGTTTTTIPPKPHTPRYLIPYQAPSYGTNYNQRNEQATETAYEINNCNRQLGSDQNNRYREPSGQFQRPTTTMELKQEVYIQCRMTQKHSYNPVPFPPEHTSPEWAASSNMMYSQMNQQSLMSDYTTDEYLNDSSPEDARRVQISSSWRDTTPECMRHGESFDSVVPAEEHHRNPTLSNHLLYGTPSSSTLKSSQRTISMNTTVSTDTKPGLPASVKTRFKDRLGNRPTGEQAHEKTQRHGQDFVSAPQLNTPLSSTQRRQGGFVSGQCHEQFSSMQDDDNKLLYSRKDVHKNSGDLRHRLKNR